VEKREQRQRLQSVRARTALSGFGYGQEYRLPERQAQDEPHGFQGPSGPSPDPDWDYYWPTKTSNAKRPATLQARYSPTLQRMEIVFRDGTPWTYTDINQSFWDRFKRAASPGKIIYNLWPPGSRGAGNNAGGWGSIVGE
jgi:hypothetical protein